MDLENKKFQYPIIFTLHLYSLLIAIESVAQAVTDRLPETLGKFIIGTLNYIALPGDPQIVLFLKCFKFTQI